MPQENHLSTLTKKSLKSQNVVISGILDILSISRIILKDLVLTFKF